MDNELEVVFPQGKEVTVKGITLNIKPFKMGELPKVFRATKPLFSSFTEALNSGQGQAGAFAALLAEEGVLELMAIGSKQPQVWIADLEADEGLTLLMAIIEVNMDFFVHKVLPMLVKNTEKLQATAAQAAPPGQK